MSIMRFGKKILHELLKIKIPFKAHDWPAIQGFVRSIDHLRNRLNFDLDKNFITALEYYWFCDALSSCDEIFV
jgi:hypothetical protein